MAGAFQRCVVSTVRPSARVAELPGLTTARTRPARMMTARNLKERLFFMVGDVICGSRRHPLGPVAKTPVKKTPKSGRML